MSAGSAGDHGTPSPDGPGAARGAAGTSDPPPGQHGRARSDLDVQPSGLVTLIVGETGRPAGRRARPDQNPAPAALQWSSRWTADGPGPVARGCEGEPDLTLTLSPDDARLVKQGELAPSVAFMQGRLKTAGDNALLLRVLAWTATPAFGEALKSGAEPSNQ